MALLKILFFKIFYGPGRRAWVLDDLGRRIVHTTTFLSDTNTTYKLHLI